MRITRIELENIKSYRRASVELRPGTTAIRGQNGAGKSTLVEAIGFALFDALSYKQAQFVREGEKLGTVTVSFLSALDGREYQVVRKCGNASEWFAYDPDLGERVVEQRADVVAFLRQHLRIEGEVELSALFSDALGVPQGTFTADFLLTPAQRKKKFDTLLQVEDYRKAAEKLLDTRNYLIEQRHQQDRRIDALEREAGLLEGWRQALAEGHARERELAAALERIQAEAARMESRREALRRQEAEVTRLETAARVAGSELSAVRDRAGEAQARVDEARAAVAICAETQADYQAFVRAEGELAEARRREQQRTQVRQRRAAFETTREGARRDLEHAQARLREAEEAAARIIALLPGVDQQTALERQRAEMQGSVQRIGDVEKALSRYARDIAQADHKIAQGERTLAALDERRAEAEQLAPRRQELEKLQVAQATYQANAARLKAVRTQAQALTKQITALEVRAAKATENLRKIQAEQHTVEAHPRLEAQHKELSRQAQQLETRIEQHRRSREASGQGNCPFLQEPCLNIQRRGENSLASYFDRLIATDEQALAPLRAEIARVDAELERGRQILTYWTRLDDFNERQQQAVGDLASAREQQRQLADEDATLTAVVGAAPDARALSEARAACDRSEKAAREYATRETVARQVSDARAQREQAICEKAEQESLLTQLRLVAEQALRLQEHLDALGDPAGQTKALQPIAREKPEREARVGAVSATVAELDTRIAEVERELAGYAGLDDQLAALEAERVRTQPGHTRYLQHQRLAERLPEVEAALATVVKARQEVEAKAHAATQAYERASAGFDAAELARLNTRADELSAERGRTTQELRQTQQDCAQLAADIARVERLQDELRAARAERQTLDDLERMLQQFRETIKEAGPNILRALLRHISVEANRIYGEVLGDRSAQLTWENDYEIVVRRDGRERSFSQLSGGEQMSAALAVRLALLRNLSRLDLAFFDEPTQNMDDERRGNLAEQIRRVRGFDQLLVISHDDTFEQGLDGVVHLEKRHGETVVVEEDALVPA